MGEAGATPTPAGAVSLRRPLVLIALYVAAFTALLVLGTAGGGGIVEAASPATARVVLALDADRGGEGAGGEGAGGEGEGGAGGGGGGGGGGTSAPRRASSASPLPPRSRDDDRGDDRGGSAAAAAAPPPAEDSSAAASSFPPRALPSCALHVYRHLSKTGGTTIRFVFDKNTAMGEWEYPLPYGFDEKQWVDLLDRWRRKARAHVEAEKAEAAEAEKAAAAGESSSSPGASEASASAREASRSRMLLPSGPRTLVEVRGNWPSNWAAERFLTRILPDVHDLRREFEGTPCEITTSTMLRDPADQYLSFYHYYIEKNQRRPERGSTNENDLDPNAPGPEAWGSDFAEWASGVRDMQVREMLGNKCVRQMREPRFETRWDAASGARVRAAERSEARKRRRRGERGSGGGGGGGGGASEEEAGGANANVNVNALVNDDDDDASGCGYPDANGTYSITPADYARFESAVRAMDVVSSTERFDAFLARLRVRVGVRHVAYVASNRGGYRSGDGAFGGGGEEERREEEEAARRKRVAETVAAVASFDWKAHALATELDDAATREGKAKAGEARAGAKGGETGERSDASSSDASSSDASSSDAFAATLAALAAPADASRSSRRGGASPASPFRWILKSDADREGSFDPADAPSCFTEPTGGGQALAYIVHDPVRLVRAEKTNARCVKGCNLDG